MGRKSSLTPEQWIEAERRHLVGKESINSLAKVYRINESTLRRKLKPNKTEGKSSTNSLSELAEAKVAAEMAARRIAEQIAKLPIAKQEIVADLSRSMMATSFHLGSAGELGAMTAHRLLMVAKTQSEKIDPDADLATNEPHMKSVLAMTRGANDAASIGLNLLAANRGAQMPQPVPVVEEIPIDAQAASDAYVALIRGD